MQITAIRLPTWGLTMEEGTLVKWLVPEGAVIEQGMEIAEIENSKAINVLEADTSGVMRRQVAVEGETVACGALIGVLAGKTVAETEIEAFISQFTQDVENNQVLDKPSPSWVELTDGRRVRYLKAGIGGTPALLLHGFGGDLDAWQLTQTAFAADREVFTMDLPGHGESTKDLLFGDLDELAETVLQTMDALGLEKPHLIGHSLGGGVALQLSLQNPNRVSSLALIAPVGLAEGIDSTFLAEFLAARKTRDLQSCLGRLFADPTLAGRDFTDQVARNKRLDGAGTALAQIVSACFPNGRQIAVLLSEMTKWVSTNPSLPVTVIWGDEDVIVPPLPMEMLPSSVSGVLLPGIGHMPQLEAAKEVNSILSRHMGAVT